MWAFMALLMVVSLSFAQRRTARLYWLGVLPGGTFSNAKAVSNDGMVVGYSETGIHGESCNSPQALHAFYYWNGILIDVHPSCLNSDMQSTAEDVTADGKLIVGSAGTLVCDGYLVSPGHAYAWVVTRGMIQPVALQGLPNRVGSIANSVSYIPYEASVDERLIAGTEGGVHSSATRGVPGYYRFNAPFVSLPLLQDVSDWGSANGISGDGHIIVGVSHFCEEWCTQHVFRPVCWRDGLIQELPGGGTPYAASGNGFVIVGESGNAASIWLGCPASVRIILDTPGGGAASDVDVSGKIVVGSAGSRAYRWIANRIQGEDLNVRDASLLQDGSILLAANGISPNGRYIVGSGYHASVGRVEAYLIDVGYAIVPADVNEDGCIDDADLLLIISQLGNSGWLREDINSDGVIDNGDLMEILIHFGDCSN